MKITELRVILTWTIKMSEMTSVTARALYMVTEWDRKWWRDESWGVTGGQATKVQKWRAGVNCSKCEQWQPEMLGPRRWIVECGRRSVMNRPTRHNGVADEPRRPPLDTVHRRGTTVQTRKGICIRGEYLINIKSSLPTTHSTMLLTFNSLCEVQEAVHWLASIVCLRWNQQEW